MKGPLPIHPFLFAIAPILLLYALNAAEVPAAALLAPLELAILVPAVLLAIAAAATRDRYRGAAIVSLLTILFFSYGHVRLLLEDPTDAEAAISNALLLQVVWAGAAGAGTVWLAAARRDFRPLTRVLNATGTFLLLSASGSLLLAQPPRPAARPVPAVAAADLPPERPDIWLIVLDRYARADVLAEDFAFDNRGFLSFLTAAGFIVADQSLANYHKTAESLAATLNMTYLDDLADQVGRDATAPAPLYAMLSGSSAVRTVAGLGYRITRVGSWWGPTASDAAAHENINPTPGTDFTRMLVATTFLSAPWLTDAELFDARQADWERTLAQLDALQELASRPGPKLVFAHLLVPHYPYLFAADGSYRTEAEARRRSTRDNYVDQVRFLNDRLQRLLPELIERSEHPPVIVLQSDEGPYPERFEHDQDAFDWHVATPQELSLKFGVLNALHLPCPGPPDIRRDLSPVNTFRLIFDRCLGTRLGLLPDRSFAANAARPYDFFPVAPPPALVP